MKTGRNLIWIAAAAAFACAACEEADYIGRDRQDLDNARDVHDEPEWPTVPPEEVEELPGCSEIDVPGGAVAVYIVEGGEGLLALAIDGTLICVDDSEGLEEIGIPGQFIPDDQHRTDPPDDGTLLPSDGTPLPAGGTNGGSGVTDGTPLPA